MGEINRNVSVTKELSVHLSRTESKFSYPVKFRYINGQFRNHDLVSAPVRNDVVPED